MEIDSQETQAPLEKQVVIETEELKSEPSESKTTKVKILDSGSKFVFYTGLSISVLMAIMPFIGSVGSTNPTTAGTIGLWVGFLGEFHPVFLHLPIGALVLIILMEILGLFSKKNKINMTLPLAFCACCSVLATIFGYFLYLGGEYQNELMEEHKRDGIIFTILLILTFLLRYKIQYNKKKRWKFIYPVLLFLSGGMMLSAGHHGGEVTHGNPLDKLPTKVKEKREAREVSRENRTIQSSDSMNNNKDDLISELVVYTDVVHPIIEEKCVSCHGPKKVKGGLKMDTIAHMLEGGDAEECLVKGDVKASYMITSMKLPLDDEYRMPPEGKPQITEDELKVLKWWVEIGAPESEQISELNASEAIIQAIKASMEAR